MQTVEKNLDFDNFSLDLDSPFTSPENHRDFRSCHQKAKPRSSRSFHSDSSKGSAHPWQRLLIMGKMDIRKMTWK